MIVVIERHDGRVRVCVETEDSLGFVTTAANEDDAYAYAHSCSVQRGDPIEHIEWGAGCLHVPGAGSLLQHDV